MQAVIWLEYLDCVVWPGLSLPQAWESMFLNMELQSLVFFGASLQIIGWLIACIFGNGYLGLIVALITVDIGTQFQQLSNQTGCIAEIPEASNRANTIFMTLYFIGGSLGTFLSGLGWSMLSWNGVCIVGASFAMVSLAITSSRTYSM